MNIIKETTVTIPSNYTFSFKDSSESKTVTVFIDRCPLVFNLWTGSAYDAAGNYTQEQISASVASYLVSKSVA